MKRFFYFFVAMVLFFIMTACSNRVVGMKSIATYADLVAYMKSESEEDSNGAFLSADITMPEDGEAIVVKGSKELDLKEKTLTLSKGYGSLENLPSYPNLICLSSITIEKDAVLKMKNGTVDTVFSGSLTSAATNGSDKIYLNVIENSGSFIGDKLVVKANGNSLENTGIKKDSALLDVVVSGIFNRKVNDVEKKVLCTLKSNSSIIVINHSSGAGGEGYKREANGIISWNNTSTDVSDLTMDITGNGAKGFFLATHEVKLGASDIGFEKDAEIKVDKSDIKVTSKKETARGVQMLVHAEKSGKTTMTVSNTDFTIETTVTSPAANACLVFKIEGTNYTTGEKSGNASLTATEITHNLGEATAYIFAGDADNATIKVDGTAIAH